MIDLRDIYEYADDGNQTILKNINWGEYKRPTIKDWIIFFIMFRYSTIVHELGHFNKGIENNVSIHKMIIGQIGPYYIYRKQYKHIDFIIYPSNKHLFKPSGIVCFRDLWLKERKKQVSVYLAGPVKQYIMHLMLLILPVILFMDLRFHNSTHVFLIDLLGVINIYLIFPLAIAASNLLPFRGQDGWWICIVQADSIQNTFKSGEEKESITYKDLLKLKHMDFLGYVIYQLFLSILLMVIPGIILVVNIVYFM